MAGTDLYFNSNGWGFTPTGGSLTAILKVTSYTYDEGISTKKESGDFDAFPTAAVTDWRDPTITLETLNAFALETVLAGARGILTGTVRDATNGATASGGGKTVTMTNCFIQGRNSTHAHREFGRRTLIFGAISVDGATHPVASSAL